jgi:hypothetical protein
MKIREDKFLCISPVHTSGTYGLSRKGEFPVKLITPFITSVFSAFIFGEYRDNSIPSLSLPRFARNDRPFDNHTQTVVK